MALGSSQPPEGEALTSSLEQDVTFDPPANPAPRFLGAALNEYRPVSGVSSFNGSDTNHRISRTPDEMNDPSTPFMSKDANPTSPTEATFHILDSGTQPRRQSISSVQGKEAAGPGTAPGTPNQYSTVNRDKRRNKTIGLVALGIFLLAAIAAILGGVLGSRRNSEAEASSGAAVGGSKASGSAASTTTAMPGNKFWGVGGDTIKTDQGSTFVYNNTLGGTWVSIPFNDTAKPQGDQPALSEKWDYSANRILGVNIGGWLVLEPFISPYLFEPYSDTANPAVDEWTLCERLGSQAAATIEDHYKTFITEQDFAEIAAAGLNWVRLPVGWWMIETWSGEPLVEGIAFKYFQKAITWARKYGLRINLDLHSVPGSQNGWNHSGRFGTVGFLNGVMGVANAQRTLNYVRTLTQFISQPQYSNVIPMFSVLNEAQISVIGPTPLRTWYYQVYQMLRSIGGVGEGKGPFMVIHDGFGGTQAGQRGWDGYLQGADRLGLDTHAYFCFNGQNTDTVAANSLKPCATWGTLVNQTMAGFGLSVTGEFSLAVNDCGLFVNNVGGGSRYEGTFPTAANPDAQYKRIGSCTQWLDDRLWSQDTKTAFADMAQTQQDSARNSFFWTWKIGRSIRQDNVPNPMWNYQQGLKSGYIRPDARQSNGRCQAVAAAQGATNPSQPWAGPLSAWQTGGPGAGTIAPAQATLYSNFPPASISGGVGGAQLPATALPSYVATGTVVTLVPTPVSTGKTSMSAGSGWANPDDKSGWYVPQSGCNYVDPWGGVGVAAPTPVCGATNTRRPRGLIVPQPTPVPSV